MRKNFSGQFLRIYTCFAIITKTERGEIEIKFRVFLQSSFQISSEFVPSMPFTWLRLVGDFQLSIVVIAPLRALV